MGTCGPKVVRPRFLQRGVASSFVGITLINGGNFGCAVFFEKVERGCCYCCFLSFFSEAKSLSAWGQLCSASYERVISWSRIFQFGAKVQLCGGKFHIFSQKFKHFVTFSTTSTSQTKGFCWASVWPVLSPDILTHSTVTVYRSRLSVRLVRSNYLNINTPCWFRGLGDKKLLHFERKLLFILNKD